MSESVNTTEGHTAGGGLDTETLAMMLQALHDFVGHALTPRANSNSTTTTCVRRTSSVR
ncbi:MAG: hypothetical protein R2713_08440 [Ilumatobacteraceae bacterium]